MRQVDDHAGVGHGLQQGAAALGEAAFRVGAVGVGGEAVVGQAHDSQAILPPEGDLLRIDDGVGTLHAQDVTQRCGLGSVLPGLHVGCKPRLVSHLPQLALRLQDPVIGQLSLRLAVGDLLVGRPRGGRSGPGDAADDGRQRQGDLALAHLGQGGGAAGATLLRHARLATAQLVDLELQVAVPVEGVHGQVEMGVDQNHWISYQLRVSQQL